MTDRLRLEQLMTLRERRERLAAAALAAQQRRCRDEARRIEDLELALERERDDFDRLEQAWFDAVEGATLSPAELAQARQAIDDHQRRQAELAEARSAAERERCRLLEECARRAETWSQRCHARQALGKLLERRRRDDRIVQEGRLEADLEVTLPRGGPP
ncbi:hypothetical protein HOP62_10270 [Halomonas sp. MCCC 1A17488]|uniref:hypothetical protein n=1 Tax=unclassified Halomonas TaxID=2609666 RepID=UPI0018D269CA|nr:MULTISPECIES: hypothetical protein [unclassified Halomonas]MCE8016452.1 hypothetical protein [Halomonas sp. MCCC 1A17488]MCG3239785.1 hypothetical protein [Halomonas sp. MCCC 1A17488]QPP50314.1 hypothetical protein I4484_04105 [Halomonas sp. SS10-MC5]